MGYTALLFCPDEKTARTVTQVLSELEFTVEACIEPFAAVKKLMGQHFDAVVVDCDNEQNATLLFKSARNSASNQTSLAVAVVEGQAGVAKAFRIGANLVLTKPINIEQSKGTLRVARGLLRKSEPTKPAASGGAAPSVATASKPVAPVSQPTTGTPAAPTQVFAAQPAEIPEVRPTPAWSAAAVASSQPASQDDDLLAVDEDEKSVKPAVPSLVASPRSEGLPNQTNVSSGANPMLSGWQSPNGGGAASAPAPAREAKRVEKAPVSDPDDDVLESATEPAQSKPSPIVGSAPSFTLGGAEAEAESRGAGKKIIIGIAAAAIVAAGLYFGWTHFHGSPEQPMKLQVEQPTAAPTMSAPVTKPSAIPTPAKSVPVSVPSTEATKATPSNEKAVAGPAVDERNEAAADDTSKTSTSASKPSEEDTPEAAPMRVGAGKAPAQKKSAGADAAAPSVIGMSTGDIAPPPIVTSDNAFKPTLQTLNVSQGVSQGLLIKKVPPSYPPNALRMRVEGKVELMATISKTGDITSIQVLSGDSQLTKAATAAVKQWKYKPYLLNGEPVEIQTQVTVNFRLPQ